MSSRQIIFYIIIINWLSSFNTRLFGQLKDFPKLPQGEYKLFVGGECHSVVSEDCALDIFLKLYEEYGVRKFILELPRECQIGINVYLNDTMGDSRQILMTKYGAKNEDEIYLLIKELRSFNLGKKNKADKIEVICPDITPNLYNAINRIGSYQAKGETENQELNETIRQAARIKIFGTKNNMSKKRIKMINKLKKHLENDSKDLKDLYLDDFSLIETQINFLYALKETMVKYHGNVPDSVRERFLYENILFEFKRSPDAGYYAQFGGLHTFINYDLRKFHYDMFNFEHSMIDRLNRTKELSGAIYNMLYYYRETTTRASDCNSIIKFNQQTLFSGSELNVYNNKSKDRFFIIPIQDLERGKELKEYIKAVIFVN